jgi:hypothetical protein
MNRSASHARSGVMRRARTGLLALWCAAAVAGGKAEAQELRLFLAHEGLLDAADESSAIEGSPTLSNPVAIAGAEPVRLYLWAQMLGGAEPVAWQGVGVNVLATGSARVSASRILAFSDPRSGFVRWQDSADGRIEDDGAFVRGMHMVAMTLGEGVTDSPGAHEDDAHFDPATGSTLLGWIEVTGQGEIFLGVDALGIARRGAAGPPGEPVHMGFGDEDAGLLGSDFGAFGPLSDASIVQCPADCNEDGALNIFDFLCFSGLVTSEDPRADCNNDGAINIFDFLCFRGLVTQGCG